MSIPNSNIPDAIKIYFQGYEMKLARINEIKEDFKLIKDMLESDVSLNLDEPFKKIDEGLQQAYEGIIDVFDILNAEEEWGVNHVTLKKQLII